MKTLSAKRMRLLELIGSHQRSGQFPLVRELAEALGLAGESSLGAMLRSLERDGYLLKHGGGNERRQRVYTLTAKGDSIVPVTRRLLLPVLGQIPAGPFAEAVQGCAEFLDPGDALRAQPSDFFLIVGGDSMIGDGILPADRVLLRPGIHAGSGEIAGVQIKQGDGLYEGTLKRVYFAPGKRTVRLRASNPAYPEIVVPAKKVIIAGVYRGLIRPFV